LKALFKSIRRSKNVYEKIQQSDSIPYPLVIKQFAIENGPVEIVSLPIDSMVDLSSSLCGHVYQRLIHVRIHTSRSGDGSKPWYLVNPKIAGKWMFIPLKMYL
jgi:hypothetical protein